MAVRRVVVRLLAVPVVPPSDNGPHLYPSVRAQRRSDWIQAAGRSLPHVERGAEVVAFLSKGLDGNRSSSADPKRAQ